MPDTKTTRGEQSDASVGDETVTNTTIEPSAARLPSTGAAGADKIAILGGGLLVSGLLLLLARRRMPSAG